jgi:hypothetical protein
MENREQKNTAPGLFCGHLFVKSQARAPLAKRILPFANWIFQYAGESAYFIT